LFTSNFGKKAAQTIVFGLLFTFFVIQYTPIFAQALPSGTGTLKVLAVMVEFEEDDNEFTSGNGLFGPGSLPYMERDDIKIDPLPHNFSYFDAHLTFAKNYFTRASSGQLTIDYNLLPTTYKLNKPIADYSPTGEDFDFALLAELVKDVWTAVDNGPELNLNWTPDEQTALVIFHAGVGRDIELIGTILDKTYQDIPSIYLSRNALSNFSDTINPDLFRIKNGTIPITNSLIIPRTLSRRGELFEEEQVVSFSINGLLVASIASHIGLPDLFNTDNGQSAIGQFGLMDGAGFILSYNGLFPPLPSAWERMKLGWDTPFLINDKLGEQIDLPAPSLGQVNNTIAKYEITKDEYFLFENRFRNVNNTGVELTYRLPDGSTATQRLNNIDSVFSGQYADFDSLLLKGVLIDADNLDFALPGGLDYGNDRRPGTDDDRALNGGVLIWHVNESVINANPTAVNADDQNRGVDLEEADGAQDIGFPIEGSLVDLSSGHAYDFWWEGNDYRVITEIDTIRNYENRFGLDTRPNSNNQAGGATFFEAFDFSNSQEIASFRYRNTESSALRRLSKRSIISDNVVSRFANSSNRLTTSLRYFENANQRLITSFANNSITIFEANNPEVFTNFTVEGSVYSTQITQPFSAGQLPLLVVLWLDNSGRLHTDAYRIKADLSLDLEWEQNYSSTEITLPTQVLTQSASFLKDLFGTFRLDLNNGSVVNSTNLEPLTLRTNAGSTLTINSDILSSLNITPSELSGAIALSENNGSPRYALFNTTNTWILGANGELLKQISRLQSTTSSLTNEAFIPAYSLPAFADITNDGNIDIIQANADGTKIHAYNTAGTELDGFPISLAAYKLKVNGPLLLVENTTSANSTSYAILFEASDNRKSYLLSINTDNAKMQPLFPLTLASPSSENAVQFMSSAIVVGEPAQLHFLRYDGVVEQWEFQEGIKALWGSTFGNTDNADFTPEASLEDGNEDINRQILNIDETYNWPNPVRNGQTSIRYQSIAGASIAITIAQPSGKIVYKTNFNVGSSLPESYQLSTSNWSSGVYLVNVTATLDGQSQKKIIKMVVVQ
jgi:hypothetical protein